MVELFGEEKGKLEEFFSSILFHGPMASAIKSEKVAVISKFVLEINQEKVGCRMFDNINGESVSLDISFEPSIPGEVSEDIILGLESVKLIHDIVKAFPNGETVFFDAEDDNITIRDVGGNMSLNFPTIDVNQVVNYDPETFEMMKSDDDFPLIDLGEEKREFNIKTKIDLKSLKPVKRMNEILKTPHVNVKFNGGEVYLVSVDLDKEKVNHFKAKTESVQKLTSTGKWRKNSPECENIYPVGIIPAIDQLDEATLYARDIGNGICEQLLFIGERNDISKKYFIGAGERDEDETIA